jgi:hypothetical protein
VAAVVAAFETAKSAHASLAGYLASLALGVFLGIAGAVAFWRLVGFVVRRADQRSTKKLSIGAIVVFMYGFALAGMVWVVGVLFASMWTTAFVLRYIS